MSADTYISSVTNDSLMRRFRGRGLHSSTFQLNLSRSSHKRHPEHPLLPPDASQTPPRQPLNAPPIPHKALTFSREVDECKPLFRGMGTDDIMNLEHDSASELVSVLKQYLVSFFWVTAGAYPRSNFTSS